MTFLSSTKITVFVLEITRINRSVNEELLPIAFCVKHFPSHPTHYAKFFTQQKGSFNVVVF